MFVTRLLLLASQRELSKRFITASVSANASAGVLALHSCCHRQEDLYLCRQRGKLWSGHLSGFPGSNYGLVNQVATRTYHDNHRVKDEEEEKKDSSQSSEEETASKAEVSGKNSSSASGFMGLLPKAVSPYARLMRLDKPIGSWLLAWPSFWSIALAANQGSPPDLQLLALFGTGAVLLRGAGCTINDLWDRDLDSKVERTRQRPLASKEISASSAVAFLGAQLSLGLAILMQLNTYSQLLGAASLPLVVSYPLMKRITNWPQAVLGCTINWGALLGWSAVHGSLDLGVCLPLYFSGIAWTLVYDTVYAHQDKVDDVKVGIKSTALHFGNNDKNKLWLSSFAVLHGLSLASAGVFGDCGFLFYSSSLVGTSSLLWKIRNINLDDPKACMNFFTQNKWYGALIFSGIVLDRLCS